MSIKVAAPGKLVLLGEYAVLEGYPALVAAVDRYAHVTLTKNSPHAGHCLDAPDLAILSAPWRVDQQGNVEWPTLCAEKQRLLRLVSEVIREVTLRVGPPPPCHIHIDTSAFLDPQAGTKLGLGSSAAVAAALYSALTDNGLPAALFTPVLKAHRRAQSGRGSGVDVAASLYGGFVRYVQNHLPVSVRSPQALPMLAIYTGRSASTPDFLGRFAEARRRDPKRYIEWTAQMGAVSRAGIDAFSSAEWQKLSAAVAASLELFQELGDYLQIPLLTPEHMNLTKLVGSLGGVYKPSGAGGGDMGLALAQSLAHLEQIKSSLRAAGHQVINLQLGVPGLS